MPRPHVPFAILLIIAVTSAHAQSLYLSGGESAVEASVGWSVGPYSRGIETFASVALGGRVDLGLGISRYTYAFEDGFESKFTEYAPFVRYFPLKQQQDRTPLGLSLNAQLFVDDYGTDDRGRYIQIGTTVYRLVRLTDRFALQPFVGFAFVAESYTFGGGPAETAEYLTRDLGLHFSTAIERQWVLRVTLIEQSFRRETYRGARAAVIRRL